MGNFNKDRGRSGGGFGHGFGNNKSFGSRKFSPRDSAKTMHKAICSECGQPCEVPFKPTGDRPIYCSNCFGKQSKGDTRPNKFGSDRSGKQMFDAVCDKCGRACQIPFRPSSGKPVYCENCFGKSGSQSRPSQGSGELMQEIKKLNVKMDELIKILSPKILLPKPEPIKVAKVAKAKKVVKATTKVKTTPKKATAKKKK